jgi:hypothetical protein
MALCVFDKQHMMAQVEPQYNLSIRATPHAQKTKQKIATTKFGSISRGLDFLGQLNNKYTVLYIRVNNLFLLWFYSTGIKRRYIESKNINLT